MKSYLALLRIDLALTLRKRAVLFFHYLLPIGTFVVVCELLGAEAAGVTSYVAAMLIAAGIVANGFFGAGMRAVQERENNTLRRFKVAPISPMPLLCASLGSGLIVFLPAAALLLALARLAYGMALPDRFGSLLVLLILGVLAFRALGLVIASVANSVQESQILIQLVYLPMMFLSGATIPVEALPAWARRIGQFMPASYLVAGLREIFSGSGGLRDNAEPAIGLALTAALGTFLSAQLFRWDKDEKIRPAAKLWVVLALAPFVALGALAALRR